MSRLTSLAKRVVAAAMPWQLTPRALFLSMTFPSLLPCALKTLSANKDAPIPVKLFEVSDVVLFSDETETGAVNERRLVAVYSGKESGFEVIHGTLCRLMQVLGVPVDLEAEGSNADAYSWSL